MSTAIQEVAEGVKSQVATIMGSLDAMNDAFYETREYTYKVIKERDRLLEVVATLMADREKLIRGGKRLLSALDKQPFTGIEDLKQDVEGRADYVLREAIDTIEERLCV